MLRNIFAIATIAVLFFAGSTLFAQVVDNSTATANNQWTATVDVPISVTSTPSGGVDLGSIAPGLTRTFANPVSKSIYFKVAGASDALYSLSGTVALTSGSVTIAGIVWEENVSGWGALAYTTGGGPNVETMSATGDKTFKNNGERDYRVYPSTIAASVAAAVSENPVFAVTCTATYTGY